MRKRKELNKLYDVEVKKPFYSTLKRLYICSKYKPKFFSCCITETQIPDLIDNSLPLEQQAFELRNKYRMQLEN